MSDSVIDIKLKFLVEGAAVPLYAKDGDAAFDLVAVGLPAEGAWVSQDKPLVVGTGIAVEMPMGWKIQVHSRSGLGFKNDVRLANSVAIIDAGYRGEIMIKLAADGEPFHVSNGDRIAQAYPERVVVARFKVVDDLSSSERGTGGLGHSGLKS